MSGGPIGALALLVLTVAACGGGASGASGTPPPAPAGATPTAEPTAPPEPVELTIYGAASLQGVLEQVKAAYEARAPGTTLTISTDSSAALETQIEQGAPADVFLAADTDHPQQLIDRGLAAGQPTAFASTLLTIIVPTDNPGRVASPMDLGRPGLKVVAAGDEVPITMYASQLVENLARLPGYGGFVPRYVANIVSKEDNVKNVVAKIELGEGDAAIVYVTDANASTKVQTIDIPAGANVRATYAGVVVGASTHAEAAAAFLEWFAGPDGQAILADFGFAPGGAKPAG